MKVVRYLDISDFSKSEVKALRIDILDPTFLTDELVAMSEKEQSFSFDDTEKNIVSLCANSSRIDNIYNELEHIIESKTEEYNNHYNSHNIAID